MKLSAGLGLAVVALAACAGGRYVPAAQAAFAQSAARTDTTMTTAWGKLVSDPDGKALAGVSVEIFPWKPCRVSGKKFHCSPAIVHTTTRKDGRFQFTAPNGHYLLVIGSDSGAEFKRPTVHDSVRLTGGTTHLLAPVLPTPSPVPNVAFWPVQLPADQRHGLYRLTKIEPTFEAACLRAIDAERQRRNLNTLVADEWLTENERTLLEEYRHAKIKAPIQLAKTAWFRVHGSCAAAVKALARQPAVVSAPEDFGWLPPEINSARMYAGAGAEPMASAGAAWEGLVADVGSLTNGPPEGDYPTWP